MISLPGCTHSAESPYASSAQFSEDRFRNPQAIPENSLSTMGRILWRYITEKRAEAIPASPIPVEPLTRKQLLNDRDNQDALYRLGHSSILMTLNNRFWLIDPVFSDRASPFSWAGPERFHKPPVAIDNLPEITGVIISHDHYDHLDRQTIEHLKTQTERFFVPLGVGKHLEKWGVDEHRITELDWWQAFRHADVTITATPAQHFSGRGLTDSNRTLWASWVIQTEQSSVFYSGDSGYFDGFKEIGRRYGPFDLTIMENGAYDTMWQEVHMLPEQTLQAHTDVRGKALLPVHNSTFDLAFHDWHEPLNRLAALAEKKSIPLITPRIGQRVTLSNSHHYQKQWWLSPVTPETSGL